MTWLRPEMWNVYEHGIIMQGIGAMLYVSQEPMVVKQKGLTCSLSLPSLKVKMTPWMQTVLRSIQITEVR